MMMAMTRNRWILIALLCFGILGVISTYTRLSATDDEGFHISCGMEWWQKGTYLKQPLHPPLARVMDAAGLYIATLMSPNGKPWAQESQHDAYINRLIVTRLGVLPFYIFSCALVYLWSRRLYGDDIALWSLGLYVTLSSVTAHAGLATTDMGYTAMFLWSLYQGVQWMQAPTRRNSIILGISLGIMIGTKFSGVAQWPAAMAVIFALQGVENRRQGKPFLPIDKTHITSSLYIIPGIVLMLALIYRFSFQPLIDGINMAQRLSSRGFGVWLYGPLNHHGVWYFFPVVFFFKTPLAFHITSIFGFIRNAVEWKRGMAVERLFPFAAGLMILLISTTSNINLGVRHVLPMYPLLAITAGYGLHWIWTHGQNRQRALAGALIVWQVVGFAFAYPEHIAYFNELAGDHPEEITLDSDFDWGQAMILLDEATKKHDVSTVFMCARKDTYWNANYVVRAKVLSCPLTQRFTGWIAVGRAWNLLNPNNFTWLRNTTAVEQVGKTMDLYYIPVHQ